MRLALYNAIIYVDPGHFEEALLVEDGIITQVGSNEVILAREADEIIDCETHTLIPGLNDSHSHLMMVSALREQVQLLDASSIEDVLERCRQYLSEHPDVSVLAGMGWNPAQFTEGPVRNLTRHDLDLISNDIPILLTRACGHLISTNTKALELAGVTRKTAQVPGGVFEFDDDGPNGIFYENAQQLIEHLQPSLDGEAMLEVLKKSMHYALSLGITTVQTNDLGLFLPVREAIDIYENLYASEEPVMKTHHQICFESPDEVNEFMMTVGDRSLPSQMTLGPIKLFKDGTLGGRSALLSEGYADNPSNVGVDVLPKDQTMPWIEVARRHRLPVIAHCIGDQAILDMLDCYEPLTKADRWGLVHCQITRPSVLERMAQAGAIAFIQPIFLRSDIPAMQGVIPYDLQQTSYAWKSMLKLGIPIAIGTDAPIEDLNPFANLYWAIERRDPNRRSDGLNPNERLSIEEAVDAYTLGSAYAEGKEGRKGRLKPGYQADMVLLDRNIFSIAATEILHTRVQKTFVDGRLVYEANE